MVGSVLAKYSMYGRIWPPKLMSPLSFANASACHVFERRDRDSVLGDKAPESGVKNHESHMIENRKCVDSGRKKTSRCHKPGGGLN